MGSIKNTLKEQGTLKTIIIGIQHVLAMFGATVLVPILTGLNPSIALLSAGIGTLVFHFVTKRKVPVFLGSSFAFIAGLQTVINKDVNNIPKAMGGVIVAGCIYLLLALLVKIFGAEKVRSFFPPVVTGPIIIVIGLSLAPGVVTGNIIDNATGELWQRLLIALIVVLTMLLVGVFAKGFFKLVPILFGIVAGYIASACFGFVNFQPVAQANWFLDFSQFRLPEFDISAILVIAPIAIVTFVEHIGDITTNSAVVGKDFLTDPGLHRTLMGDGLATICAGFLGGPPNTTYGENTGVLAVTKNYNPFNIEVAAIVAIILGLFGKMGAVIQTIPAPVMGGVSIILFGMIASVGIRILGENKVDLSINRNLFITAVLLVVGVSVNLQFGAVKVSGLAIAAVLGIILNKILPEKVK
ncbi:MAG: solute carrier family 23 protein [Oscillospiraceae bacterium]